LEHGTLFVPFRPDSDRVGFISREPLRSLRNLAQAAAA
jgi:hypothetical protein